MLKLTALFDSFDNLDQISPEDIAAWLKSVPALVQLENYLANKILYPTTLPLTALDSEIDLAILREALKLNGPNLSSKKTNSLLGDNPFINITLRKILIPERFLHFVPDLTSLTWAFIDALLLNRRKEDWFEDLWTIFLVDQSDEQIGSVLLPQFENLSGIMELNILGKDYKIRPGSLMVIPCPKDRCEISYKLSGGQILGKQMSAIEVSGGKLGLVIDGRGR